MIDLNVTKIHENPNPTLEFFYKKKIIIKKKLPMCNCHIYMYTQRKAGEKNFEKKITNIVGWIHITYKCRQFIRFFFSFLDNLLTLYHTSYTIRNLSY